VLVRTAVAKALGGFDTGIWGADDWDFWFRLSRAAKLVSCSRLALFYRLHQSNASSQVERMLHNSLAVLARQLRLTPPALRSDCRKAGYRCLYRCFGRRFVDRGKWAIRRFQPGLALKEFTSLGPFLQAAVEDDVLFRMLVRDLIPRPFRRWVEPVEKPRRLERLG
jgi:hypothetical protein